MGKRNTTKSQEANYKYSVTFSLKKKDTKARMGFVMCTVTHARLRERFSILPPGQDPLDYTLSEENWNQTARRPRRMATNFQLVDARISEIEEDVKEYVNACIRDGCPIDLQALKSEISGGGAERDTVIRLFQRFIDTKVIIDPWNNKRKPAHSTLKAYKTTLGNLKKFELSDYRAGSRSQPITLGHFIPKNGDTVNAEPEIIGQFRSFLQTAQGYGDNTLSRELKNLAAFLKWAHESGLAGKRKIVKSIKTAPIQGAGHPLYDDEAERLYTLETVEGGREWHVQNLFVLSYDTALRFSDLHNLNPSLLDQQYQIVVNHKTGGKSTVFHSHRVRQILRKYLEKPWPSMILPNDKGVFTQNWRFNTILKELAKRANLDRMVQIESRKGGRTNLKPRPLCEVISSKYGRVSFVSNSFADGVSPAEIQIQTGHKNQKMLSKDGPYFRPMLDTIAQRKGIATIDEAYAKEQG